jgi:hypothetical protein
MNLLREQSRTRPITPKVVATAALLSSLTKILMAQALAMAKADWLSPTRLCPHLVLSYLVNLSLSSFSFSILEIEFMNIVQPLRVDH